MNDPSPPKICSPQMSLTLDNNYGGGVFHLKLLEALADQGVSCLIPLAFNPRYTPRKNWDVRVLPLRRTYKLGALLSNAVFFLHLLGLWFPAGRRFQILRVTDPYYIGPAALAFRRLTGVTLVANVFHIERTQYLRNLVLRWVCRKSDAVIVTSRFSKEQVKQALSLDPERIFVTYGGVTEFEGAPADKAAAKKALGLTGKTVIGFIGALSERKNPGFLLEIFADLHAMDSRRHLVFVGSDISADSSLMKRLRDRAQELGVGDHVTFTGRVGTAKKATILKAMDLFVFPSLLEGFGLAVVEAMAAGVPAVVSRRGSLPEVVRHEENGLILSLADREAFTKSTSELLADTERLEEMGRRAARLVREDFSWKTCAEQTNRIHQELLLRLSRKTLGVLLNTGDGLDTMKREGRLSRFQDHYLRRWAGVFDEVRVFSYGDDQDRPMEKVAYIPGRPRWRGFFYALLMPIIHRRIFRRLCVLRVMHAGAAAGALIAHFLWKTPLVVTYGYAYGEFMRQKKRPIYALWVEAVSRLALRRAAAVIVTTRALETFVRSRTSAKKVHLIPNGVDLSLFRPGKRRRRSGPMTLICVGRLTAQKNLAFLARVLEPIRERVVLKLVGDGPERGALEKLFSQAGLRANFCGTVPHKELPKILEEADIFLLPSRIEGHPKALLEAMAMKLACVGADVEGTRDVIRHRDNGLLVPLEAKSFRAAIEEVLDDPALCDDLGKRARRHVESECDLDKNLDREMELLSRLLTQAPGRGLNPRQKRKKPR